MPAQAPHPASIADQGLICCGCCGDDALREIVKSAGEPGVCAACGTSGRALPIGQIAVHLDKLIKQLWYGAFPAYREHDPGANLRSIVREALSAEHPCEDAIIEALKSNERNGAGKGTFYSDTAVYERRQLAAADQRSQWVA